MDKGDVAAWVAAVIAMGAAWIALLNANAARTQAGAALKQASEAQKAREAAEAQIVEARKAVMAAEGQAAIMQEQLDEMRTDRHMREGPVFEVEEAVLADEEVGSFAVKATIKMVAGPGLARVTAAVHGESLHGAFGSGSETPTFKKIGPGSRFTVYSLRDDCMTPIDAVVELMCEEEDDAPRTWKRHVGVQFIRPPESPVPWVFVG